MTAWGSSIAAIVSPQKSKTHFLLFALLILSGTKPPKKYRPNKLGKEIEQKKQANKCGQTGLFEVVLNHQIEDNSFTKKKVRANSHTKGLSLFKCDCFGALFSV